MPDTNFGPAAARVTSRLMQLAGALVLAAVTAGCASAPHPRADVVLAGGRVFTGDASAPWAEAVAMRGEIITAVGTDAEVRMHVGPSTRVIELNGRVVIPGVNDAHVHAPWPGEQTISFAQPAAPVTKESLLEALRVAAASAPAGAVLTGGLPRDLIDAGITRDDLDAVSTTIPIRLGLLGGHSAVLNTAALEAWGVRDETPDPPGGWYSRDGGRLNGWLYEHAYWTPQIRYAATVTDDVLRESITRFETTMLGYGVTSVQTMSLVGAERLERLLASISPRLRWRIIDFRMAPYDGPAGRFPVKYILDGTPVERTAALRAPYADDPSTSGEVNYPAEDIAAMVRDAARGERQLLVHAVGDRAIGALFDQMERTPADWPLHRVRLEHGDMLTGDLVARARKLGVIVVQNPSHFTIPDVMNPRLGPDRGGISQPARSLIEQGGRFAIGSDGPLNPFLNIFFATIHPVNPSERLTVAQSLSAYTAGAAYAEFAEGRKGVIAPGMLADLAILSDDIFAIAPEELPKTSSEMTIIGGRIVWEKTNETP